MQIDIKKVVDKFLNWKLPKDFNPDAGISFKPGYNEHTDHPMRHEPVGTNLFDADQAKQMFEYVLSDYISQPGEVEVEVEGGQEEDESNRKCQHLEKAFEKTFNCGLPASHYCESTNKYYCKEHTMIAMIAGLKLRNIHVKEVKANQAKERSRDEDNRMLAKWYGIAIQKDSLMGVAIKQGYAQTTAFEPERDWNQLKLLEKKMIEEIAIGKVVTFFQRHKGTKTMRYLKIYHDSMDYEVIKAYGMGESEIEATYTAIRRYVEDTEEGELNRLSSSTASTNGGMI